MWASLRKIQHFPPNHSFSQTPHFNKMSLAGKKLTYRLCSRDCSSILTGKQGKTWCVWRKKHYTTSRVKQCFIETPLWTALTIPCRCFLHWSLPSPRDCISWLKWSSTSTQPTKKKNPFWHSPLSLNSLESGRGAPAGIFLVFELRH